MSRINEILDFWFGKKEDPNYGQIRRSWFIKNPIFDKEIGNRFKLDYEKAASGKLNHWREEAQGCLALIILLDQFPRNLFRGNKRTYATDEQALSLTRYALEHGYDHELIPVQRWFIYIPLGHSESLSDQIQGVELASSLGDDSDSLFITSQANKHLDVIRRFGRFPHRNQILGRKSTPEEEAFLMKPGSSF
ncbi:MAG: DUF924 domain-containing protein [Symploca sp. SIO1B1]|nr:DUF924 domain-containing protein [Symploca sp. SIO1B1]